MSQARTSPKCFSDAADHVVWLQLDQRAAPNKSGLSAGFVCKDCTPEFKQEMMLQERCEHPEVEFGYATRKFGGHVETEFSGYVRSPHGSRLFNEYVTDATKFEVSEGEGVSL